MPNQSQILKPELWIDSYADYMFNYTISRVKDFDTAKDLVQETFLAGLKSKSNFKGEASERTWLISILKRKIIDYYRKLNSQKSKAETRMGENPYSETDVNWLEERVADNFNRNAEDTIQNKELGIAIEDCIKKLSEKHRTIFKMKTIQGYDTEAICKEFDISPSNLWVIIHRARVSLMGCLKENWL